MKRKQSSPAGQGVKGGKPRFEKLVQGNGKPSDEELARTYLTERNRLLELKNEEKQRALLKDEKVWIPRAEIMQQAAVLFQGIKRKLLRLPSLLQRRLAADDAEAAKRNSRDRDQNRLRVFARAETAAENAL